MALKHPSYKDSGVYICLGILANEPGEVIILDFVSILIKNDHPIEKLPGESLNIRCNGFEIKSILKEHRVHKLIYKDKNILFVDENLNEKKFEAMVDHDSLDGYFIKNLNPSDSGKYECIMKDFDTNRTWVTNRIEVLVRNLYVGVDEDSRYWQIVIILACLYLFFLLAELSFNLIGLKSIKTRAFKFTLCKNEIENIQN